MPPTTSRLSHLQFTALHYYYAINSLKPKEKYSQVSGELCMLDACNVHVFFAV
jgi:hypothetical protein